MASIFASTITLRVSSSSVKAGFTSSTSIAWVPDELAACVDVAGAGSALISLPTVSLRHDSSSWTLIFIFAFGRGVDIVGGSNVTSPPLEPMCCAM